MRYWKFQEVQFSPFLVSFFLFLMIRSLEACSRLCLHCGNHAAFWNQSELRIKLLLCVEFGVHDECSGFPQLCHLFEL